MARQSGEQRLIKHTPRQSWGRVLRKEHFPIGGATRVPEAVQLEELHDRRCGQRAAARAVLHRHREGEPLRAKGHGAREWVARPRDARCCRRALKMLVAEGMTSVPWNSSVLRGCHSLRNEHAMNTQCILVAIPYHTPSVISRTRVTCIVSIDPPS